MLPCTKYAPYDTSYVEVYCVAVLEPSEKRSGHFAREEKSRHLGSMFPASEGIPKAENARNGENKLVSNPKYPYAALRK